MAAKDLTGLTFGRLTVLRQAPKREGYGASKFWVVRCDCGAEKEVSGCAMKGGHTRSCGCWAKDYQRTIAGPEMRAHFLAQRIKSGKADWA